MSEISATARRELVRALAERYRGATVHQKRQILDEFVAVTGYHRKHAIRLLNRRRVWGGPAGGRRRRVYDEAVRQALVVLWETSDRVCGKRLKALVPVLLPALERHGHLHLDAEVRERLQRVSASTIDRVLAEPRAGNGRRRTRRTNGPRIRGSVPVRTFADWKDPAPGFVEADLVAHSGDTMAGSMAHTLTITDIASGWTECIALLVRESSLVVDALDRLRVGLPFPLRGIDTDNGSEFVNDALLAFCTKHVA